MSGEIESNVNGWTIDTLRVMFLSELTSLEKHLRYQQEDLRTLLDERYATQTKALDAAFLAQQTAMRTALEASERAGTMAMLNAKEAVNKAEAAANDRFAAMNEFRGQLGDQAATFMPRAESTTRYEALAEKLTAEASRAERLISDLSLRVADAITRAELASATGAMNTRIEAILERIAALELRVTSRLDLNDGRDSGAAYQRTEGRQIVTLAIGALSFIVVVVSVAFTVYISKQQ